MSKPEFVVKYILAALVCAAISTSICMLNGCASKTPIRIGFSEQLSGAKSDLGVQTRNGVQLAVEKINSSGGIDEHPIELIIKDDLGTNKGAVAADQELVDSSVVAIIGHATSEQTMAALPVINRSKTVLISPTSSAPELTENSDYFFRIISSLPAKVSSFARSIHSRREISKIAIIYDTDNAAYADAYVEVFTSAFRSAGGQVVDTVGFSSSSKPDFTATLRKMSKSGAQGLLMVANSYDVALIAQRARLIGWNAHFFGSGYAEMGIVAKLGGKAIDGMEIELYYDLTSQSPAFLQFKRAYEKRYGESPTGASALGYETVLVLAAALRKTKGSSSGLREALLRMKDFPGLIDKFSFDAQGGAVRPFYEAVYQGRKIHVIKVTEPPSK